MFQSVSLSTARSGGDKNDLPHRGAVVVAAIVTSGFFIPATRVATLGLFGKGFELEELLFSGSEGKCSQYLGGHLFSPSPAMLDALSAVPEFSS